MVMLGVSVVSHRAESLRLPRKAEKMIILLFNFS